MTTATITGWGHCVPPSVLSNHDLATVVDTDDEWITSRSGIKERRVSHVSNSDMATLASRRAIAAAGLTPLDIDYIIMATCTPDRQIPAAACYVQTKLGATHAAAADINAGCTGFLYGLSMAHGLVATNQAKRVVVTGSERISSYLNLQERSTAVLFGDGAGAVVVEATDDPSDGGIRSLRLGADGGGAEHLTATGLGTDYVGVEAVIAVVMDGAEIFKNAVTRMGDGTAEVIEDAGWALEDVDLLIPHQANIRIIDAVRRRIRAPEDAVYVNIHKYGNTSAATIPIALSEALAEGRVRAGSKLVFAAFGAGLTWGACAFEWGPRTEPLATVDDELDPPTEGALEQMLRQQSLFT